MDIRAFVRKWILPPGVIDLLYWCSSRIGRKCSTLGKLSRKSSKLYVIANGPSLTKDVERYGIAVNFLATTDMFERLKPTYYVLFDPQYFAPLEMIREMLRKKMKYLQSLELGDYRDIIAAFNHPAKRKLFLDMCSHRSTICSACRVYHSFGADEVLARYPQLSDLSKYNTGDLKVTFDRNCIL